MQNALLNLIMLTFLFLLFATMVRGRQSRRLRFWTLALFLLLVNAMLALLQPVDRTLLLCVKILHFELLVVAATVFLVSFLDRSMGRKRLTQIGLGVSVPWLIGIPLVRLHPGAMGPVMLCVVGGQLLVLVQTRLIPGGALSAQRVRIMAWCAGAGALMLAIVYDHPKQVPEMAIAEIMLANAVLLWTQTGRGADARRGRTLGVILTSGGFLVWATFFPIALFFDTRLTDAVLAALFWSLPKFLIGFGVLTILHEEDLAQADDLSEQYRLLFDHHPLPMWVFHADTLRFLMVNDAAVAHYGYTREQFAAMTIRDIRPEEELERLKQVVEYQPDELKRTVGWQHILNGGRQIAVDIFSHSVIFEQQAARIVVAIDVTQRNAAEEKLRQAYKLESLGQLTGGVAHDFNNILAIILGSLELVEQRKVLDGPGEGLVRQAIASVHRGSELTGRLLAYARKQPLEPKMVVLPSLLEETVGFIQISLGPTIEVQVVCDPLLWHAQIDPSQLENALLNLALNARDAVGENGELKIVAWNLHLEEPTAGLVGEIGAGDYVVLAVSDNGMGMAEEVIARATEPFFTTKPVGKGTGLGLSMVYGFLKQSGGHMQIASRVGEGTTVRMYLPRALATEGRMVARTGGGPIEGLPRGEEQILVVEDEHAIRHILVSLLRSLGYRVLEAEDGPMAMRYLEEEPGIDLLLTDVVLANGISGGQLAADAQAMRPAIKVLFSSGYTRNVLIHDRRLEEGVHLLTKPFRLVELATAVRRVLDTG